MYLERVTHILEKVRTVLPVLIPVGKDKDVVFH